MAWFIGLMSGTSLDGVDAVLAEAGAATTLLQPRAHAHMDMPAALRGELLALNQRPGSDELHRGALAANAIARLYAMAVADLLRQSGLAAHQITALGAHGQTVRHRPGDFDGSGYTIQLMNGALLAETTGVSVVCDLRSRDVAAGGQGAPLAPAFHAARFSCPGHDVAVLNLGGIANLTLLPAEGPVQGFDTGPGNVLMDTWIERHRASRFDADGAWAASGCVCDALLKAWLREPYFARQPPKSTGRDLFNAAWLDTSLAAAAALAPADVMATLAELTAASVVQALVEHAPGGSRLLVCGGGAFNAHLMRRLAALLKQGALVQSTAEAGVPADQVEALAFAWLAQQFVLQRPGNLPAVTGARGPRLLGALYPAG